MKKKYTTLEKKTGRLYFYDDTFQACEDLYDVTKQYTNYNYESALTEIYFRIYQSFGAATVEDGFCSSNFGRSENHIEFVEVLCEPLYWNTIQAIGSKIEQQL